MEQPWSKAVRLPFGVFLEIVKTCTHLKNYLTGLETTNSRDSLTIWLVSKNRSNGSNCSSLIVPGQFTIGTEESRITDKRRRRKQRREEQGVQKGLDLHA
jgi:hypothetical protein